MGSQIELLEGRLKHFIYQLQVEYKILDRLVYKNKNQHRRCSYFHYLLKVRRDLRLLQLAPLVDILSSCFIVINANKPTQKVHLLDSLKRKKRDAGKYNFMERLLGSARLLSQMVEPMLRAATELSILLAQSFFMGFCVTSLALLARIRTLVQQILLDIVSVFNMVSSISQKEQSIRLNEGGIQIFRQYFPSKGEAVLLECNWEGDKFVLDEKKIEIHVEHLAEDGSLRPPAIKYSSMATPLVLDGEASLEKVDAIPVASEAPTHTGSLSDVSILGNDGLGSGTGLVASPSGGNLLQGSLNPQKRKMGSLNRVAFISVKRPAVSPCDSREFQGEEVVNNNSTGRDPFLDLLTTGSLNDTSIL